MNRKQADEALKALDAMPPAKNWRERAQRAKTYDRLRSIRPKPKPEPWDWELPF